MTRTSELPPTPLPDCPNYRGVMRDCFVGPRRRLASLGGLLAMLVSATSCNSLLGIDEASLTCDVPPCDSASSAGTAGVAATPSNGEAQSPGGITGPDGTSGAPAVSGAGRDGILITPMQSVDPRDTGAPASGGSGADAEKSSAGAAGDGAGGSGGAPPGSDAGSEPGQSSCGGDDPCGGCLCGECEAELAACTDTAGCIEILVCARNSGCRGYACYCGTIDLLSCATTNLANGSCVTVMQAAPGGHPPSLVDPNAGPASEAALELANCSRLRCAADCGN